MHKKLSRKITSITENFLIKELAMLVEDIPIDFFDLNININIKEYMIFMEQKLLQYERNESN